MLGFEVGDRQLWSETEPVLSPSQRVRQGGRLPGGIAVEALRCCCMQGIVILRKGGALGAQSDQVKSVAGRVEGLLAGCRTHS